MSDALLLGTKGFERAYALVETHGASNRVVMCIMLAESLKVDHCFRSLPGSSSQSCLAPPLPGRPAALMWKHALSNLRIDVAMRASQAPLVWQAHRQSCPWPQEPPEFQLGRAWLCVQARSHQPRGLANGLLSPAGARPRAARGLEGFPGAPAGS